MSDLPTILLLQAYGRRLVSVRAQMWSTVPKEYGDFSNAEWQERANYERLSGIIDDLFVDVERLLNDNTNKTDDVPVKRP